MTETWLQPLKYVCLTGLPAVHIHMSSTEKCSSDHESKKNHIMVKKDVDPQTCTFTPVCVVTFQIN